MALQDELNTLQLKHIELLAEKHRAAHPLDAKIKALEEQMLVILEMQRKGAL